MANPEELKQLLVQYEPSTAVTIQDITPGTVTSLIAGADRSQSITLASGAMIPVPEALQQIVSHPRRLDKLVEDGARLPIPFGNEYRTGKREVQQTFSRWLNPEERQKSLLIHERVRTSFPTLFGQNIDPIFSPKTNALTTSDTPTDLDGAVNVFAHRSGVPKHAPCLLFVLSEAAGVADPIIPSLAQTTGYEVRVGQETKQWAYDATQRILTLIYEQQLPVDDQEIAILHAVAAVLRTETENAKASMPRETVIAEQQAEPAKPDRTDMKRVQVLTTMSDTVTHVAGAEKQELLEAIYAKRKAIILASTDQTPEMQALRKKAGEPFFDASVWRDQGLNDPTNIFNITDGENKSEWIDFLNGGS